MRTFYHTLRFWIIMVLLSLMLSLAALAARLFDPSGNTSHRIASLWARCLCQWNGIQVEVRGLEHVQRHRAQVFVANHQGFFDIFALAGYLPVQLRWMAKASLFRIPLVGWSMYAADYIPVLRTDRKSAYRAFLQGIEKLKGGASIVIFPEGTRSEDGRIGRFKKGGTLLALRAGAPLVPVTLAGTGRILRKGSMRVHPGRVQMIISPPIEAEVLKETGEGEVLESIRDLICRNYETALLSERGRPEAAVPPAAAGS